MIILTEFPLVDSGKKRRTKPAPMVALNPMKVTKVITNSITPPVTTITHDGDHYMVKLSAQDVCKKLEETVLSRMKVEQDFPDTQTP